MSLIEQLGGYERAKEIAFDPLHLQITHVSNDGRHWVNEEFSYIPEIQEQIPAMVRIEDIRKALLEYRRQHNIYEAGDLVTHLTTRDILKVIIIEDSNKHYRFIKVKAIDPENQESVNEFNSLWFQLKHATDAEIEAGKRLEVS